MKNNILSLIISARGGSVKGILVSDISYTLQESANVSLGVYSGQNLIRLLVSAKQHDSGPYTVYWDGKDDNNNTVPDGSYTLKVLTNNIQYTWEGAHIGNTSADNSGTTKHHVYGNLSDVVVSGAQAVYVSGFSERLPSAFAFNTSDIQRKINVYPPGSSTSFINRLATDGINNYYACYDNYDESKSFIMATKCSDNSQVIFSSGTNYTLHEGDIYNVFGLVNDANGKITGITAQPGNDYIYVARAATNNIYVYNKITGELIITITSFTNPKSVAFDKNTGSSKHLWVSSDRDTIERYTVNADGTLTSDGISITGVTTPGKIDVSYDSATVGVIDYATQQLKEFANSTGVSAGAIGLSGSYATDSEVLNNRFYLTEPGAGFSYAADGTIWLADTGNNRMLHLSSTGDHIEQIQIQHTVYNTRVDLADKTRIFGQFLEFAIDYTQPLTGNTGWVLAKNWGAQITGSNYVTGDNLDNKFYSVRTFTDGSTNRTFAFLKRWDYVRGYELVELQSSGTIRFTGVIKDSYLLDESGALFLGDGNTGSDGGAIAFNKRAFTGTFDGSNNPVWSSTADVVFDISSMTGDDAAIGQGIIVQNNNYITSDNKVVLFNNSTGTSTINHVGFGIKYDNSFFARVSKSTFRDYRGVFPGTEYYDIGNDVGNNSAASINVLGKIAIANYHGENWRGAQTNKYNVYYSNGLPLGQFGTTRYDSPGEAQPMMEGNALTPQLIAGETSDIAYLYHGGESDHSAIHRWKITGLNSVQEQTINILYPDVKLIQPVIGIDLLSGLTFGNTLDRTSNGWSGDADDDEFITLVGQLNPNKLTPDLSLDYASTTAGKSVSRVLQASPVALTTWSITGNIALSGFPNTPTFRGGGYLEVLDNTGKIICQLNNYFGGLGFQVLGNGQVLYNGTDVNGGYVINALQPFLISRSGAVLTFTYNGITQTTSTVIDNGADITKPATLRLRFYPGPNIADHGIDLNGLRFNNG